MRVQIPPGLPTQRINMARNTKMLKQQEELRDRLRREIEDLQKKLEGVEMAIRVAKGLSDTPASAPPKRRSTNVKQTLMSLLEEVGATGLNAMTAVEMAAKKNESIERATASSLLSRFKADELVTFDGRVYRLKKFPGAPDNPMH
jgi:hypothetical protein